MRLIGKVEEDEGKIHAMSPPPHAPKLFTTKPTGQGTGLGLSLSYDIIKAHGGELTVETQENEGAEFIMQIPVQ